MRPASGSVVLSWREDWKSCLGWGVSGDRYVGDVAGIGGARPSRRSVLGGFREGVLVGESSWGSFGGASEAVASGAVRVDRRVFFLATLPRRSVGKTDLVVVAVQGPPPLLCISPTRLTLSVLRSCFMSFLSVYKTCTVPKFSVSLTLAPEIYCSYPVRGHKKSIPCHNAHPGRGYACHDLNTFKLRHRKLEQSGLIIPTGHVASLPPGRSVTGL
jgi:hypothetical protein